MGASTGDLLDRQRSISEAQVQQANYSRNLAGQQMLTIVYRRAPLQSCGGLAWTQIRLEEPGLDRILRLVNNQEMRSLKTDQNQC